MLIDLGGGGRERERERERRNNDQLPSICALTGDQTHNTGMYPDQGLNTQHFGVWDNAQTN